MAREHWGSKLGFMFAAVGSAVGLANIVRFPYLVGQNGGAAFIVLYLLCLLVTGFPVFISEIIIGRNTQSNPYGAFKKLGKTKFWRAAGKLTTLTGFIISAFYSALAGWILGYLFESLFGVTNSFNSAAQASEHYHNLTASPFWGVGFHGLFLLLCIAILFSGIKQGLEKFSKLLMPLLFMVLTLLVVIGISLPNAGTGIEFLLKIDWSAITPAAVLLALGQAFFTLSAGQGTMITYGGYLSKSTNLITATVPILLADTLVSIFAAIAVFAIVFSAGLQPDAGIGLIFHTLPVVFSKLSLSHGYLYGYGLAVAFFLLVTLAAITSEVSAMEPAIAYLIDEKGFSRKKAVFLVGLGAFALGVPCALSYSLLKDVSIFSNNIFETFDFVCTGVLIPVGALAAVVLVGWYWGIGNLVTELNFGAENLLNKHKWIGCYLKACIKYIVPLAIIVVMFL